MLTNDVDLKEANERRQPNFTFSAKESCKKNSVLLWTRDISTVDIIENRDNWFCQTKFFNTATSRLEARLVFKHTQKPEKLISNAR